MTDRIKRIERAVCLIKFRKLPLIAYDKETDAEVYYFPKHKALYSIELEKTSADILAKQLIKLFELLNFKTFIFLNAKNNPWISKQTEKRTDSKPLITTINYFKSLKINNKFNGGVQIDCENLNEFLPHFYRITQCDGGFFDYHFTDINQNIIFYIHYSGKVRVLCLNKKSDTKFLEIIKQTPFKKIKKTSINIR